MSVSHEIAFVVATKDRPGELRRLWRSLCSQNRLPGEVVIVDASSRPFPLADLEPVPIVLRYLRTGVASATRQRNLGLDVVGPDVGLVGFLDDDVVLEEGAVEEMLRFWESAGAEVGGAAFNMANHPPLDWPVLKRTRLAESLGLYAKRGGAVTASGFQTMIGPLARTEWTDWLPSTASVWRRKVVRDCRFDEWFGGYSYLEDLDFSYRVGKSFKLAVVARARYLHLQAPGGRGGGYAFGLREVLNRVHFVKKYPELSLRKCYAALSARLLMSLALAVRERQASFIARAFGNAVGLVRSAINARG
ncbi:MAG: glycosyltransferase [Acidobacteria bacterium]|nr:glycosyltransferase [Acidobacteriota bacterium]